MNIPFSKSVDGINSVVELSMLNRHGLITGATGTGKTVSLKVLTEKLSEQGIPVFVSDIKGDFAGIVQAGVAHPKTSDRLKVLGMDEKLFTFNSYPVQFWDVFGKSGTPLRATVSQMGPMLLGRLMALNPTQIGVLNIVFKVADDQKLLLLDLKDLKTLLQYIGDNASTFTTEYGNVSKSTVGAVQRQLLVLENQGAAQFFGEPEVELTDFMRVDQNGKGIINIIAADKLYNSPDVYATFMLWILTELFENLPEVGDVEKPKLMFFFDEAHTLFTDAPKALLDKIEQVIKLVRSKGVGIFFITQNPLDIPVSVLGQLGNRIQHALRAFTPLDQKAVKTAADTFRQNPKFSTEEAITQLAVGEALTSFLDTKGTPSMVERGYVYPPHSFVGPIDTGVRSQIIASSPLDAKYKTTIDRQSAYEAIQGQKASLPEPQVSVPTSKTPRTGPSVGDQVAKEASKVIGSLARNFASQLGRNLARGLFGTLKR
jgi:uncharacterized protein